MQAAKGITHPLPVVVEDLIEKIRACHGMDTEGIFRFSLPGQRLDLFSLGLREIFKRLLLVSYSWIQECLVKTYPQGIRMC